MYPYHHQRSIWNVLFYNKALYRQSFGLLGIYSQFVQRGSNEIGYIKHLVKVWRMFSMPQSIYKWYTQPDLAGNLIWKWNSKCHAFSHSRSLRVCVGGNMMNSVHSLIPSYTAELKRLESVAESQEGNVLGLFHITRLHEITLKMQTYLLNIVKVSMNWDCVSNEQDDWIH